MNKILTKKSKSNFILNNMDYLMNFKFFLKNLFKNFNIKHCESLPLSNF